METDFKLLIYEDSEGWVKAFKFNIKKKLNDHGINLSLKFKVDDNTLMQDLEFLPHLIMVDYDLGSLTGDKIIQQIEKDPDFMKASIFLYSGGESITSLKKIAGECNGNVPCYTKEGNELEQAVIKKALAI